MDREQAKEYNIPANLLQAIVYNLNEQPAKMVRDILNAIAQVCGEQDKSAAEAAKAKELAAAIKASKEEVK
jgi:hypothetical protein